ncbi:MAG: hypothetical protein ACJA16_000053 [Akkermansiaceae bacterium]|jgi:hypothetical protein
MGLPYLHLRPPILPQMFLVSDCPDFSDPPSLIDVIAPPFSKQNHARP